MTEAAIDNWYPAAHNIRQRPKAGQIFQLPPRIRVILSEPSYLWYEPVSDRLNEICALPLGWDGYRGRPTGFDIARFAFNLLQNICTQNTPAPSIVPLSSGGLQIEWHTNRAEIELTVDAPYNVQAWVIDPDTEENGLEEHLTNEYSALIPWVRRLG